MAKTMSDLHETLFDTLEQLRTGKIDIEKAKAISDVAQTIINGAKVEVDYVKATGNNRASSLVGNNTQALPGHTVHRIGG